jgi:hypothetical protein
MSISDFAYRISVGLHYFLIYHINILSGVKVYLRSYMLCCV